MKNYLTGAIGSVGTALILWMTFWFLGAPTVTLPKAVSVPRTDHVFYVPYSTTGFNLQWDLGGLEEDDNVIAKSGRKALTSSNEGTYVLRAWSARGNYTSNIATCVVVIGKGPGPGPGPVPPTPAKDLQILITYNEEKLADLPPSQFLILESGRVFSFFNTVAKGKWRVIPYKQEQEPGIFQEMSKLPKDQDNWIYIRDGNIVLYSGKLPGNEEETLNLVKKYVKSS